MMPAVSNHIQRRLWRLVGFVSAVVGLLCYALSSSFNHIFGHWNFLKRFLYVTFSFIILFITWFGKVWQCSTTTSIMFKTHMAILVLLATSVYSVFYDKAVNQKPDAYILISCAAFAVMSLSLSKQTRCGCEVDLLNFFLGCLIILLMKINLWLFFVGAAFSYSLLIIRSSSEITPQSEEVFELQGIIIAPQSAEDITPQSAEVFELQHFLFAEDTDADTTSAYVSPSSEHYVPLERVFILDENYAQIKSLLRIESGEVRVIGIWGMGGIGKTTIANAVFEELSSQFECTCFVADVREQSRTRGLNYVRSRLFSGLLRKDVHINTPKVVSSIVRRRLRHKRVLIVLDDVYSSEFVKNLVGVRRGWLGAGSRVIVTSRDKYVLKGGGVDEIHDVHEMNLLNSLQLFSLCAFSKIRPEIEYEELSKRVIVYASGLPLALKLLGSFLRSKTKDQWESQLRKLKMIPIPEIMQVLKLSFDELGDAEKEIFLDIACFFEGRDRDQVSRVLDACGFFADSGIEILVDKALITFDSHNCIKMHDLIQDMGREIIRLESSNNPGERRRLWNSQDVMEVLTNHTGTAAVQSMFLDMTQITDLQLRSYAFRNMPDLRLLAFDSGNSLMIDNPVSIPEDLELPRKLRYLQWDGYPLKYLPSSIHLEMLVDLSMPHSNLQKLWDGAQNMPWLKKIYLAYSKFLIECPDLTGAPNLESVSFLGCESLDHLHPSIFSLQKLEELDVSGCTALKSLCSKTCSPSLRRLLAVGCTNLRECSITMPDDQCKTHLHMKLE